MQNKSLKDWFIERKEQQKLARPKDVEIDDRVGQLWVKCYNCGLQIPKKEFEANEHVCPECDYHFRINARTRISQLFDENSFSELFTNIKPTDPLTFVDTQSYKSRIDAAQEKTKLNDAVICGNAKIDGYKLLTAVMDFDFMGGSMGSVVGEKVTLLMEKALETKLPVLVITASGGARMQESALSLMQMAKTSLAVSKLNDAGILYMTLLTEPTFGGVTASFGTIGDIIIAEKGARIGFAGRRVIEGTIRQKLPDDFQTAEYLLKYGQVDIVARREELRSIFSKLLSIHSK
ncbi:MAG: acetyl-CoA carboxylase, carboxyltransferase subunit beta [Candidatus Melainabacteria bacterium]|nr:MAG: acetyl-CoA carboxylase, carboxyltransferase subunit beta [Candidatus Melainabacteria bacterium]